MNKSKLTLIIDGNWLLMSRWAVLNGKYTDDDAMCKDLQSMLLKSINIVLHTFPDIDNIIFVSDGGSWRNSIKLPSFLNEEYKGNRTLNPDVNWDLIFKYYEEFIDILKKNKITACQEPKIEGDDWCWYWSTKLNNENTNVIIWSMDKDLTQLVKTNKETGIFTVVWNKNSLTIEDIDYSNGSELDFFFGDLQKSTNDKYLHSLVSKAKNIVKITPKHIIIDKIVRGDSGDNIFPILIKKSESSDRKYRVAPKDLKFDIDIHDEQQISEYITSLLENKTYLGKVKQTKENIIEHFKYNTKLVTLEKESYPQEILDIMNNYNILSITKDTTKVNNYLVARSNQLTDLLNII